MIMYGGETERWSNLPPDLLARICKLLLETPIELFRFRAVCSSNFLLPTLRLPQLPRLPNSRDPELDHLFADNSDRVIGKQIIYRLKLPTSSEYFLLRVDDGVYEGATRRLLSPLSLISIEYCETCPLRPPFNLLDFHLSEISRDYLAPSFFRKSLSLSDDEAVFMGVHGTPSYIKEGPLYLFKFKSGEWSMLDRKQDGNWFWCGGNHIDRHDDYMGDFMDVITYKGKFLALKRDGTVLQIDPGSKQVLEFAPPIDNASNYRIRRLVYSNSFRCLLLVDIRFYYTTYDIEFGGLYKLDEDEHEWVQIQSLGDEALFMSQSSTFFVSCPKDFSGYKNNCIYFLNQGGTLIFNLEDLTTTETWDDLFL